MNRSIPHSKTKNDSVQKEQGPNYYLFGIEAPINIIVDGVAGDYSLQFNNSNDMGELSN